MVDSKRNEEYFWERYQILTRTEQDSSLYNLLSGVGPIETFSDVRTVLEMYDAEAKKVKPNYWANRCNFSFEWQKNLGSIGMNITCYDSPSSGKPIKKEDLACGVVLMIESILAGECEIITDLEKFKNY